MPIQVATVTPNRRAIIAEPIAKARRKPPTSFVIADMAIAGIRDQENQFNGRGGVHQRHAGHSLSLSEAGPRRLLEPSHKLIQYQQTEKLPEGKDWLYELKFDGYRALAIKSGPRSTGSGLEIEVKMTDGLFWCQAAGCLPIP